MPLLMAFKGWLTIAGTVINAVGWVIEMVQPGEGMPVVAAGTVIGTAGVVRKGVAGR